MYKVPKPEPTIQSQFPQTMSKFTLIVSYAPVKNVLAHGFWLFMIFRKGFLIFDLHYLLSVFAVYI